MYFSRLSTCTPRTTSRYLWKAATTPPADLEVFCPARIPTPTPGCCSSPMRRACRQEALSICRIAAVRITSAEYNDAITYLPEPSPAPSGCNADCEAAVRSYLPVGTTGASINAGGQTVANGRVLINEFGVVVIVGNENSNPTFVSTCKAEVITT